MKTTFTLPKLALLALGIIFTTLESLNANPDNSMFAIYCPDDVTVSCTDELWDLEIYGNAYYHDYNGYHDAGQSVNTYNLNSCNIGNIIRTWTVYDYIGNAHSCSQVIYVTGNTITNNDIYWPENIDIEGCSPETHPDALPDGFDRPDWDFAVCSIMGTNWEDHVYDFGPGCYKIIREWTVIDCCVFNPITGEGQWKHFQVINVSSGDTPVLTCPSDVEVSTTNCTYGVVDIPDLIVDQNCNLPVMITNDSPYAYNGGANASGEYPIGTHEVTFMVKYGCWQKEFCIMTITVLDDKKPQPLCIDGLAIPLMGIDTDNDGLVDDGMVEIWASDFDHYSYHPCNPDETLIFSFSPDPSETSKIFTCEDVGENEITIWVTDEDGDQNYCTTHIDIQNNGANIPDCEPSTTGNISGNIEAVFHNVDHHMRLNITSSASGIFIEATYDTIEHYILVDSFINGSGVVIYHYDIEEEIIPYYDTSYVNTDQILKVIEGDFTVEDLPFGFDYTLELELTDNLYEYIDQNDADILNLYLHDFLELSPLQMLAADVNQDQNIDLNDLQLIQAFIDGTITEKDLELGWKSLNGDYPLPESEIVLNLEVPSYQFIPDLKDDISNVNLIIYQMADLTDEPVSLEEFFTPETAFAADQTKEAEINKRNEQETSEIFISNILPNPFSDYTSIFMESESIQNGIIRIYNLGGQLIYSEPIELFSGVNQIIIDGSRISAKGILIYELSMQENRLQGKLFKE